MVVLNAETHRYYREREREGAKQQGEWKSVELLARVALKLLRPTQSP